MKLLIEIGVEELPAIPFLKELPNIEKKWEKILEVYDLKTNFKFFYTPRRLIFLHDNFLSKQPNSIIKNIGAPKNIAQKDGKWTKAAISFANKCEISENELKFKEINGKEVLYCEKEKIGKNSKEILEEMINKFLLSLNFGKSMRWGDGEFEFIRPITSIICMLDNENVKMNVFGIKSQKAFFPHRTYGYEKVEFNSIDEYFNQISKNGIIIKDEERKSKILLEFKNLEKKYDIKIQIDDELLNEVIAITEYPTAILGKFQEEFLELPSEVIITSMKVNQRYFPVFKNDKLLNAFIVVSNAISDDNSLIIKGNEKVLKARLSDAMFFYKSDLKTKFDAKMLENIVYMKEIGSVAKKEQSEAKLVEILANLYKNELSKFNISNINELLNRAIMLSKTDLSSLMVGEFSELQGIMGGYYAKNLGEHELVCIAIKEQYLPNGEKSALPSNLFSSLVAISCKLDTLMSLFSINKIPSGNKDPYALRRAANGVLRIILNENLNFDLSKILKKISLNYIEFDINLLIDFMLDRMMTMYNANPSIIKACINSGQRDIKKLNNAINALNEISKENNFKDKFDTFKRLSNIIKNDENSKVNPNLFELDAEKNLYNEFKKIDLYEQDCKKYLNSLFNLKNYIDDFFDKVMINVDNQLIKSNRMAIVSEIYNAFLKVADIKEISF